MFREDIICHIANDLGLDVKSVEFQFDNFIEGLKRDKPSVNQIIRLEEFKKDYLNKLVVYEDDDMEFTWVIKCDSFYLEGNKLYVHGNGLIFDEDEDVKSVNFVENMDKCINENMELELISEDEVLEMIDEMKETIIYNVKATLFKND